ncbi:hypothetical protein GN956_G22246 [Arapaima gigas]
MTGDPRVDVPGASLQFPSSSIHWQAEHESYRDSSSDDRQGASRSGRRLLKRKRQDVLTPSRDGFVGPQGSKRCPTGRPCCQFLRFTQRPKVRTRWWTGVPPIDILLEDNGSSVAVTPTAVVVCYEKDPPTLPHPTWREQHTVFPERIETSGLEPERGFVEGAPGLFF